MLASLRSYLYFVTLSLGFLIIGEALFFQNSTVTNARTSPTVIAITFPDPVKVGSFASVPSKLILKDLAFDSAHLAQLPEVLIAGTVSIQGPQTIEAHLEKAPEFSFPIRRSQFTTGILAKRTIGSATPFYRVTSVSDEYKSLIDQGDIFFALNDKRLPESKDLDAAISKYLISESSGREMVLSGIKAVNSKPIKVRVDRFFSLYGESITR